MIAVNVNAVSQAFLITLIAEVLVILCSRKVSGWFGWLLAVILINSFTHPIVIYLLHVLGAPYVVVEFGVIIFEALWYSLAFSLSLRKSFVLSGVANLSSILAGVLVRFFM